jgi:hypothetical protein
MEYLWWTGGGDYGWALGLDVVDGAGRGRYFWGFGDAGFVCADVEGGEEEWWWFEEWYLDLPYFF